MDARVLDDAISYEKLKNGNTLFKVHISDPLAILPYDSNTIEEAKERGTTIYHTKSSINMFPLILSADKLSLNKDQERFAKTFCYEFDKKFNIVNFYVLNTIVKVSDRLSYDEVNKMYKNGGRTKEEDEFLTYYNNVVASLKQILSHVKVYHEQKEKSGNWYAGKNTSFSENLVSYSMILTGYMTSKYFKEHKLPYAYRCNNLDSNWLTLLDKMIANATSIEHQKNLKMIKGNLLKSYYSIDNIGHLGLHLDSYSHITSPLRRFCDLLNLLAVDTCYFKNPTDSEIYTLETEIKRVSEYLNMQNNTIDDYMKCKTKIK